MGENTLKICNGAKECKGNLRQNITFIHFNYINQYNNYSTTPKRNHLHNLYVMQCNNNSTHACGTNLTKVLHTNRLLTSEPQAPHISSEKSLVPTYALVIRLFYNNNNI